MYPAPMSCYGLSMMPRAVYLLVSLLCVPLIAGMASCGDDEAVDERPDDGTVEAWGSCMWDGSVTPELCADPLVCNDYGVCMPPCTNLDHCVPYGFGDVCDHMSGTGETMVCVIRCLENGECPDTGGAVLRCDPLFNECH